MIPLTQVHPLNLLILLRLKQTISPTKQTRLNTTHTRNIQRIDYRVQTAFESGFHFYVTSVLPKTFFSIR